MDWKRNGLRPFIEPSFYSLIASTTGQQQPFGRLNKKSYIQSQIMGPHKFLLTASSLQLVRWTALFPLRAGRCRESIRLGAAQVALKSQACIIGERPILFGTGPLLYLVAYQYVRAGAKVQAILDTSPWCGQIRSLPHLLAGGITFAKGLYYLSYLRARGVLLQTGVAPVEFRAAKSGNVGSFVWADSKSRRHEPNVNPPRLVSISLPLKHRLQIYAGWISNSTNSTGNWPPKKKTPMADLPFKASNLCG